MNLNCCQLQPVAQSVNVETWRTPLVSVTAISESYNLCRMTQYLHTKPTMDNEKRNSQKKDNMDIKTSSVLTENADGAREWLLLANGTIKSSNIYTPDGCALFNRSFTGTKYSLCNQNGIGGGAFCIFNVYTALTATHPLFFPCLLPSFIYSYVLLPIFLLLEAIPTIYSTYHLIFYSSFPSFQ